LITDPVLDRGFEANVRVFLMMAQGATASPWGSLIPLVIMLGIFYFLLIAPMRKRQKQQEQMIANLKNGDKVVTAGGIYGTIVGIKDDRLTLRIADQVKIEVTKSSISGLDAASDT
jgi:preprotein translocase subunit YajC